MSDLYNMIETLKYRGRVFKLYDGTVTASGDNHGTDEIDALGFKEGTFFLYVSAHAGGGAKSVTVTIETRHPDPNVTAYEDLVAFTAVTSAPAQEKKAVTANLGSKLSLKWALTDTTSFSFSVYAVLKIM